MQDDTPWGAWVKRQDGGLEERGGLYARKSDSRNTTTTPRVSGQAVREYLDRISGWRPIDLADEIAKSRPFVAKLLRGERNPKGDDLTNLAYALSVKPEWLYLDEPIPYEVQAAWLEEVRARVAPELVALEPDGTKRLDEADAERIGRREGVHFSKIRDWHFRAANNLPEAKRPKPSAVPSVEVLNRHVELAPESPSGLVWAEGHPCAGEIAGEPGKIAVGSWIVRIGGSKWPATQIVRALARAGVTL